MSDDTMEREKISFKPGHRARAVFLIFDYIFLIIMMILMVIPLLKVFVDSVDPTTYGIRLWPKAWDFGAYKQIIGTVSLYRPFLVSVYSTVLATVLGLLLVTLAA